MPSERVTSEVQVCNLALSRIKKPPIGSLEQGGTAASECATHFAQARDKLLRDGDWNFASARARLPKDATDPEFGFAFRYAIPANCLAVREVKGANDGDWELAGRHIETDLAAPIDVRFTRHDAPVAHWDPMFVEAMVAELAKRIAPRLLGSGTERQRIRDEATEIRDEAGRSDSQERGPTRLADTAISHVRGGGLDAYTGPQWPGDE